MALNEFDYEVRQRANLARSAKYKKCGSRSKRASLPSDRMTAAQLRERNGEIVEYNLAKPMGWGTFKRMPDDLKRQYIVKLRLEYGANQRAIAEMFRVAPETLRENLKHLKITFSKGGKMEDREIERWNQFINGGVQTEDVPPVGPIASDGDEVTDSDERPAETAIVPRTGTILNGAISFSGPIADAMQKVYALLGDVECKCTIQWECGGL